MNNISKTNHKSDVDKLPVSELARWAALFEVVALIENKADEKKIKDKHRWKLYKTSHIKKYIDRRSPEIEHEIEHEAANSEENGINGDKNFKNLLNQ